MEKGPKIGKSLEGDIAIPEFETKKSKLEIAEDIQAKESGTSPNRDAYLKESLNRHWIEIIQDHIDEFSGGDKEVLNRASANVKRKNRRPTYGFRKEEIERFFRVRGQLWRTLFGMKFGQWEREWQSALAKQSDKKASIEGEPMSKMGELKGQDDIESWEGEGGATREVQEERVPAPEDRILMRDWLKIVAGAKSEFPENIQLLIEKRVRDNKLSDKADIFAAAINKWWKDKFGFFLWDNLVQNPDREKATVDKATIIEDKKEGSSKKVRLEQLHKALKNLDDGEPVDEFRDETRRVVYYDEESERYFAEVNAKRKYPGIGDIMSDYAWGIKYVPDGDMIEPAYRQIAKRILVNETRRDIEFLSANSQTLASRMLASAKYGLGIQKAGFVAEVEARELLNRASLNNDMAVSVMRASGVEDNIYKYDFKIRVFTKNRGVDIEGGSDTVKSSFKKVGIQFTLRPKGGRKEIKLKEGAARLREDTKKLGLRKPLVDEIILVRVPTDEFRKSYERWLKAGQPSGGPEQFLSRDLKIKLLKEVTKGLIEISDEEIEKIFPKEEPRKTNEA